MNPHGKMNSLELQLDYPHGDTVPAPGQAVELAPGVHWLRMGLPFALDHINVWLLADTAEAAAGAPLPAASGEPVAGPGVAAPDMTTSDAAAPDAAAPDAAAPGPAALPATARAPAWTIVDCGVASDATRTAWQDVFTHVCRGVPVARVLATHCHPDHVGLADWLCRRWHAPLWMSAGEYAFARMMAAALPGADGTAALPHFRRHGLADAAMIAQLEGRKSYYPSLVPAVPAAYRRLQDGQRVRIGAHLWRVITGFGHAPEHVALYCADLNVLISGDMVLPRISTNVSVFAIEPEADPLRLYLDSLGKFADLPADVLVLPSHGRPFRGLHTRIAQLHAHHAARLGEVMAACAGAPQSAAAIVPVMFRRALDAHQLSFALGEALAHLHYLWFEGKLRREIAADGCVTFRGM